MKTSIKLAAAAFVLSAGLFAAVPSKAAVTFSSLNSNNGVAVKVDEATTGKAIVIIYDEDGNVLRKDALSSKKTEKDYILSKLENGDYTIEVTSDKQVVKKQIHVYDEDQTKTFIIKG